MRDLRPLTVLICLSVVLTACSTSRIAEQSSETHFLESCITDCGEGLSCLCGVCTQTCAGSQSCEALADGASCEAPIEGSCTQETICDFTCERDSECTVLDDRFLCSAGRCREPRDASDPSDSGVSSDAMTSEPQDAEVVVTVANSCEIHAVITRLSGESELMDCDPSANDIADAGDDSLASLECVRTALQMQQPFHYVMDQHGEDSLLLGGFFGVRGPDGLLKVSSVSYDNGGVDGAATWWTPLAWFQVKPACTEAPESCFVWSAEGGPVCQCVRSGPSAGGTLCTADEGSFCEGAVGTVEEIGQTPRANRCAEAFALSMGNELTADAALYERIDRDLEQIVEIEPLTANRCPELMGSGTMIYLETDNATSQAIASGAYTDWSCLNEHYGLISHSVESPSVVSLSLKGRYRLELLLDGYRALRGVQSVSINDVSSFSARPTTPTVEQSGSTLTYTIVVGQECGVNGDEGCTPGTRREFTSQANGEVELVP